MIERNSILRDTLFDAIDMKDEVALGEIKAFAKEVFKKTGAIQIVDFDGDGNPQPQRIISNKAEFNEWLNQPRF